MVRNLGKKTKEQTLWRINKKTTQRNKVLRIWENYLKIYLNTQYHHQENALNYIAEAPSNLEVEQMIVTTDEIK